MIVRHQEKKKPIHLERVDRKRSTSPRIDPKVKVAKAIDHKANAEVAVEDAVAVKAVVVVKAEVTEPTDQLNHKKSLQSSNKKKKRKLSRNLAIDLLRWIRMIDKYN